RRHPAERVDEALELVLAVQLAAGERPARQRAQPLVHFGLRQLLGHGAPPPGSPTSGRIIASSSSKSNGLRRKPAHCASSSSRSTAAALIRITGIERHAGLARIARSTSRPF